MTDPDTRQRLVTERVEQLAGKPDFPAFSEQIDEALRVLGDEKVSAQQLTELVLRNYSLTLKVLCARPTRSASTAVARPFSAWRRPSSGWAWRGCVRWLAAWCSSNIFTPERGR